jgi:nicotinate-nucleotide adenylyltransferase
VRRLAVFGGTFNPPHIGHILAANAARDALSLSVLFVPTGVPPYREIEGGVSAEDRLAMTRLAAREVPGAEVSDIEIKKSEPSYTADTLEALRGLYPGDELWLILGGDMLKTLEHWYRSEWIFTNVRIAALSRGEDDSIRALAERYRREHGARVETVDYTPAVISSSEIRGDIKNAEKWLSPAVFGYIKEKGLYCDI